MSSVVHFSPHPDDEMIGAPATLMALRDAKWRVVNVACSLGRPDQRPRREAEALSAADHSHFEARIVQPPVAMSSGDDLIAARERLREIVRRELDDLRPQIVVSPNPHDRHHAHELVAGVVRDVLAERDDAPRWWMWGLWDSLPLPTLATAFDAARLEEILAALEAYGGELARNDYRSFVKARAEMNASLGPELLFGFGAETPEGVRFVELLTEVAWVDGRWQLGKARWLSPSAPLAAPSDTPIDRWLDEASATDRFGPPGIQGRAGAGPSGVGPAFDEEERGRLWNLTLHEDNVFNQRHAFFLIAEAMLAVTYATALNANENLVAGLIAAMGLLLTAAWLYVSARHGDKVNQVQGLAKAILPDYRQVAESTSTSKKPLLRWHSRTVTGLVVPIFVGILWVALLAPRLLPP